MSWTFAEERPIYWEEPPEQIAITKIGTGERDSYMLTSAAAERIRELRDENTRLRSCLSDTEEHASMFMWEAKQLEEERDKLHELVRDVVLLAGIAGCDVAGMQIHAHGGDWRTVRERMEELGVEI